MKKTLLSVFLFVSLFLSGVLLLSGNVYAQIKGSISCEQWKKIAFTDECKYYSLNSKEKNQTKDLGIYCFSEPAKVTDQGSSYDLEINLRSPDYIAAFEWDKCGVGGGLGGNKTESSSNSKSSPDSLSCNQLFEDLKETGGPNMLLFFNELGDPVGFKTEDVGLERKNGSSCKYTFDWGSQISTAVVTYLDTPPESLTPNEGDDFEIINSGNKSYGGITVNGEEYREGPLHYGAGEYNYAKAEAVLGNCAVETKQEYFYGDKNPYSLSSEEDFRNVMKDNLRIVKSGRDEMLNNSKIKNFCEGKGGSGSPNSIFSSISSFLSNFISSIFNIFKPSSKSTLGVATSTQGIQSQQLLTLIIAGVIILWLVRFITRKKTSSRKRSKKRNRR